MRSKTSFFNAALWRKTICRFWPLWVIYLAVWFFVLLLPLGSSLRWWIADGYSAAIEASTISSLPGSTAVYLSACSAVWPLPWPCSATSTTAAMRV